MAFLVTASGLLVHIFAWGVGLAMLATPRRWAKFWPVFAGVAGLTLQSAVVWVGVYAGWPGTNAYAWAAEALPLLLVGAALWRRGWGRAIDVFRFSGLWLAMGLALVAVVWPWVMGAKELTTFSLGSCDAADYAAGARVFQEFAQGDRSGFLGLTEVVSVGSTDNFFDFWVRLNHFTPSALMALNGAVFGLAPHQMVSAFTAVCLILVMPIVFWLARETFGYGPRLSVGIALLYGVNPINWYAVCHVATAQLLAANAIALVTWAGIAAWRSGRVGWHGIAYGGLLGIGYGLIWGSYNFIIVVALVPALAYVGAVTLWTGDWWRAVRWTFVMAAPMVAAGVFFWERVAGLIERFLLFQRTDFGWRIPVLSPEGWLGAVATSSLDAHAGWARVVLSLVLLGLTGAAVWQARRRRDRRVWLVAAFTVPVLVGYAWLQLRGVLRGTNASYDAYKLFSVFYPGLLCALAFGATLFGSSRAIVRWTTGAVVILFAVLDVQATRALSRHMRKAPFAVDPALASVQTLERRPEVDSLNMVIPDMWSRLWANAFLLRKAQYFSSHTYEGRLNTELKGRWDLTSGLIRTKLPADGTQSTEQALLQPYAVVDTQSRYYIRATFGEGWYDVERLARPSLQWCWSRGDASLVIENPHPYALRTVVRIDARSLAPRDVQIWVHGRLAHTGHVSPERSVISAPAIELPPGRTEVQLRSSQPPVSPGGGDTRSLAIAAYGIELLVQENGEIGAR